MNIKEVENRTGLERANIYFYEKEGLIKPARLQNGYRDYSDEDLKFLMKIKLLRSLHISLDDIRALVAGKISLSETMERQIQELEIEEEKAIYARTLCENIRDKEISFGRLDAEKYLNGVPRIPKVEENPYFSMPIEVYPQTLFPWRRFFARMFDLMLYEILLSIFFALAFGFLLRNPTVLQDWLLSLVTLLVFLIIEPLCLHFFGTTPGKAIWGLSIKDTKGKRLSFKDASKRTLGVFHRGLGFMIPIYQYYRYYKCYQRCTDHRLQDWEVDIPTQYTCKDKHVARPIGFVAGIVLLNLLLILTSMYQIFPPNRGELTIEELVENYHYYAKFYNYTYDGATLMPDGQWKVENDPYTIKLNDYNPYPTYQYKTDQQGHVKEVSFTLEITDNDLAVAYPDDQIILLTLAMMGAAPNGSLTSKAPTEVIIMISRNCFEDFSMFIDGVLVESTCEYTGYLKPYGNNLLYRDHAQAEDFFQLTYSCSK